MRIALLTWSYHPVESGLARAAVEIAEGLSEAGAEATVFSLDRSGIDRIGAVRVVGAAPGPALGWLRRRAGLGHLVAPFAFARAVRRHGPFDVVEATNWYAPGLFAPRLVTRHSTPSSLSAAGASVRDRFDHAIGRLLERLSAQRSVGHISNTRHHGEAMAHLYRIPPLGRDHVAIGLSVPDAMRRLAATQNTEMENPPHLVFVGRGTSRKGFDLLAAAVNCLASEAEDGMLPAFTLTLVGCGEDEFRRLSTAAQRLTRTANALGDAELAALYACATVVVAPSRYESFGLVYREALLFGAPVVALASEPSAADFFGETPGGVLVNEDPDALAAALRPLLADASVRRAARQRALAGAGRLANGRRTLGESTLAAYAQFGLGGEPSHSAAASPAE